MNFSFAAEDGTQLPMPTVSRADLVKGRNVAVTDVGPVRRHLSDHERELHIADCGMLMERAMKRYEETSCFSDLGEAQRWLVLMEQAIKGRSAVMVRLLERKRGLS